MRRTDWKAVADELYMFAVGYVVANAAANGRDVEATRDRLIKMRDESIEANTKEVKGRAR